jgi:hypothetical protein
MNDKSETFSAEALSPAPDNQLRVLSCMECESPVVSTASECPTCGTPVSGKEFPYMTAQAAGPDIRGLFKWWGIWSLGVWAVSGFSFGIMSWTALSVVSAIYLLRIMRAYYR